MPKKKHRKKVRSSKRAAPRKVTATLRARPIPSGASTTPRTPSPRHTRFRFCAPSSAVARPSAAEHHEPHGHAGVAHHARKAGTSHHSRKRSQHHVEPVVTEKSFENMLAFRRFQNHAR